LLAGQFVTVMQGAIENKAFDETVELVVEGDREISRNMATQTLIEQICAQWITHVDHLVGYLLLILRKSLLCDL
jgi:hypothetical protein